MNDRISFPSWWVAAFGWALIFTALCCEPPRPVEPVEPEPTDAAAKLTVAAEKAIRDYARAWEEHHAELAESGDDETPDVEANRERHNAAFKPVNQLMDAAKKKGTSPATIHKQLAAGYRRIRK